MSISHAQTLAAAMQQALDTHPEIQSGIHARLSVDAQLQAAQGGYLPQVDLLAGQGHQGTENASSRGSPGNGFLVMSRTESSLQARQMLFDGFATRSEVDRQRATVNARAYALLGNSERIGLNVVQVYLDVLKRQAFLRLAEENLGNHQRIFDQISRRSEQGVGRLVDLNQAQARLALARNNLTTEQTNLADARVSYLSAVGQEPGELTPPPSIAGQLPPSLAAARDALLANSPHLNSAEADVMAAQAQYRAANASFYPRVDAEMSLGSNNNVDGVQGRRSDWQLMLRMRYNLFAGGKNSAELRSKSQQVNQAKDVRDNALRALNEDLGLSWNALKNAREQLPVALQYTEQSLSVRNAYRKQFTLGDRTLLDLLDSENELFTASRRLEEMRFVELFTQYRIQSTVGSLLKSQGVVPPPAAVALDIVKTDVRLPPIR
ncbi:TolC family outer membrane protein [Variovorax sp. H27-G14]|uniref:TolC family outer membrane protein n=1 Tax=Variovorax sp. H27-G14 TaxID=3111914 RepID=UPI0038FCF0A6